ncbi:MAG TPA: PAS domain-containing protein [Candidatus Acidoferrales bacterium]|nr:PAS domain-containing protein [Candidatus Acidoferrales bacterium]
MSHESESRQIPEALQARLARICESVAEVVFWCGLDGSCEYVNKAYCDYVGLARDAAEGHGWEVTLHPDDRERHRERWVEARAAGQPYRFCFRLRSKEGSYRWFEGRAYPLHNPEGEIMLWVGLAWDIEERVRMEQEAAQDWHVIDDPSHLGEGAIFELVDPAGRGFELVCYPKNHGIRAIEKPASQLDQKPGWRIRKIASLPPDPHITTEITIRVDRLASLFAEEFSEADWQNSRHAISGQ